MTSANTKPDELKLNISTCTRLAGSPVRGQESYQVSNTRTITGWQKVRVARGIERCPSGFSVSYTELMPGRSEVLVQPGDKCEVYLGSDLVLTGFVDRFIPSFSGREHTVHIEGRSKCQDLVDCSLKWPGGEFRNMNVLEIAQALCSWYGIEANAAVGTNVGARLDQYNALLGETVYDLVERLCRFRALLVYDQPDGSLLLASAGGPSTDGTPSAIGTRTATGGLKEGVNVQAAGMMYGMDGRFSDYDAVRQALDVLTDIGDGGNLISSVVDPGVPRFRYQVILSEQTFGGQDVAVQRANWEMARRIGRSYQIRLTTDSWRDAAGALWEPNTLVTVDLPSLKMRTPVTWLISDVTYKRDENGTTADLVIMPPAAFYQQPIQLFPIAPDIVRAP